MPRLVFPASRFLLCDLHKHPRLQPLIGSALFCLFLLGSAQAAPLSGTLTVGSGGSYATIGAAISAVQANGLSGPLVLELLPAYVSTGETFPLVFTNLGTSAANTFTLRPAAGATGLSISSGSTTATTVDLNGAKYLTIDGRPGGEGLVSQLAITNTSTAGVALRFINEAANNVIQHTTLRGVNTSASSGVVVFSTTTGANGNDNNTIDACDIREGASLPANGLYALGTTTTTTHNNSGNVVSNCNIFNFHPAASVDGAGIRLDGGNTSWTISGCSFYQTATRTPVAATLRGIHINNSNGVNFAVTGNSIGGSAPGAGGTAWTTATGVSQIYRFAGIHLLVGSTIASSVQGNRVQNMTWSTGATQSVLPGIWSGIYVQLGNVNVGGATGNKIGSSNGTSPVSVTTSGAGGTTFGIGTDSPGAVAVTNNGIGSITTNGSTTSINAPLVGIQVNSGTSTISGNTVGSTSMERSLNAANGTSSTQHVTGIFSASTAVTTISDNTVANLHNQAAGAGNQARGIVTTNGTNTISGNLVNSLSSTVGSAAADESASVLGILQTSMAPGQLVSQNVVHSLSNSSSLLSSVPSVYGIYFTGPVSGTNVIEKNFVHSLALSAGGTSSEANGIRVGVGTVVVRNNMVRIGISAGESAATNAIVRGIYDNATTDGRTFHHNSVYVGGTQNLRSVATYAFASAGVTNVRTIQNNIFVNVRTNNSTTGKHYAVSYEGTVANPPGLTTGGNLLRASAPASGGALGRYNAADHTTLEALQAATGQETSSLVGDPQFINATADALNVDLHLQAANPAEGTGRSIAGVTDDFDGEARDSLTPVDIGADAGNFVFTDVYAPIVDFAPLGNASTDNRVLTSFAFMTDHVGVAGGANAPRLYFKRSTDADVFGGNTAASNGWKYVLAGGTTSPFGFTIDHGLLFGGAAVSGDVIQYFVAAQDPAGNLGSKPVGAAASASPPVQNVNAHGAVNSYIVYGAEPVGTRTVGPGGDYSTIGNAILAIQARGLAGPLLLELLPTYVSTGEAFPLVFSNLGATAVNTVTLRPAAGAAGLVVSSASTTAATVDLNGARHVTIDGRPGGVGTTSELTIANTSTSGVALRFINDASSNVVRNTVLRGVSTSATSGVVVFSTTTGAGGNDNNLIESCDIRDGATTPANGLYAKGTVTQAAQNNSGNTISNCNVFNYYSTELSNKSSGIRLDEGNTEWTLTGNSFFQTASRVGVGASGQPTGVLGIYLNNTAGGGFVITGNFIGGGAPGASGTPWTATGITQPYYFVGMQLNVGASSPTSVQGNVVQNIAWSNRGGGVDGIDVQAGAVNIGTETGNTIGSATGTGSISLTAGSSVSTEIYGILSSSTSAVNIANNTIGSLTGTSASTSSVSVIGIEVTAGVHSISGNVIGSATTADSLNAANATSSGQDVVGIRISSSGTTAVTDNLVANLTNATRGSIDSYQTLGISASAGRNTITGNTIRNLTTASQNTGIVNSVSIMGIYLSASAAGQVVSRNVIHSLSNTTPTVAASATGVYAYGGSGSVMDGNLVHSLALSTTSASSYLTGLEVGSGFSAVNNMVRLGVGPDGGSTAGSSTIMALYDAWTSMGRSFLHNSVYVGGQHLSGAATTHAFVSYGTTNTRVFQNNIFINARTTAGGTGKHYAVGYGGSVVNPAGLDAAGNILFVSGAGGFLGRYANADRGTMALWRAVTGQDSASLNIDPQFVNATGNATTVDLHLQTSNPAESGGVPMAAATVTTDIDGQTRAGLTPTDIGADAGNFTSSAGDIYVPAVSFPTLGNGSTSNRVLTGFASITDNVAVAGGANRPRLYYKKGTDASVFGANSSAVSGWKFVSASNATSPYSFTMDYSLVTGGGVTVGDTVQYFVVAQDDAGNLGSMPAGATAGGSPPVQSVGAAPTSGVKSFTILPALGGTKTVGSGGDYPTLSGAGGLFAALNSSALTADLVVSITSDLTETGTNALNQMSTNNYPAGAFSVTLTPGSASTKTISGNLGTGLLRFYGVDRLVIDGRFAGAGRYLTLRNTSTSGYVISLANDSSGNTVRNCVVEGAGAAVIDFDSGVATGNDDNIITENQLRDLSTTSGRPASLVNSANTFATVANSGNVVSNNEMFNCAYSAIAIDSVANESWSITGNNIYETARGVELGSSGGVNLVSGNHVHDLLTTVSQDTAIYIYGTGTTTVSGNRITSFSGSSTLTSFWGVYNSGSAGSVLHVVNNRITLSSAVAVNRAIYGIWDEGAVGSECNVLHNTVVINGTSSANSSSWASTRKKANTHRSFNNIFLNNRSGGTSSNYAAGSNGGGSYSADHNVYVGRGATAASFMDYSTGSTTTAVTYSAWQQSIGGDANSTAGNPGGSLTPAMFLDATTGDLRLPPVIHPLLTNAGTPLAAVTTDADGDPRSVTTPTIGSDESSAPAVSDIAVEQPEGEANNLASGDSRAFGSVNVGSSAELNFTVRNLGNIPLSLTGTPEKVAVSGPGAASFSIVAAPASPVAGPAGRTTFTVRFAPATAGLKTAVLSILSDTTTSGENPFLINLTGTANGLPVITSNGGAASATINAPENATAVTVVTATDSEVPATQTLTYGKAGNDQALFALNPGTGALTFISAPNYEQPSDANGDGIYEVTVTATDSATPFGSASQNLLVTVTNVNEAPTDIVLAPTLVPENNAPGSVISILGVVDPDAGQPHTFALVGGAGSTDNAAFTITGNMLSLNASADFETKSSYLLRIRATEAGQGTLSVEKACVITIQDVGEGGLSGLASVGPTGTYKSIGAAISSVQVNGLVGPLVLELEAGYLSSVESFPLSFTALGTSATNTLTLRPAANATGLSISSADTTAATVDLNGAKFVLIDGRPGGAGAVSQLVVANTSLAGIALRFVNEASNNIVRHVALRGVNNGAFEGVVTFGTTTGANGNDNNTLDRCDIGDGASLPANGIYAQGTTTTTAQHNSGNVVSNCNIFNFQGALMVESAGARLDDGNTDWTFMGNSFYQTAVRDTVATQVRGLYFNTSGGNFTIQDNSIGGSAPGAGAAPWATSSTLANCRFMGIHLKTGSTMTNSVQGNTIRNMAWNSAGGPASNNLWSGVYVQTGSLNMGTVTPNTIGSGTGTGSVAVTSAGDGGVVYGVLFSGGVATLTGNTIGSISTTGTQTTVCTSLVGVMITTGQVTLSGNVIGSATTAGSLNAASSSNSAAGQQVAGIVATFGTAVVTGNTVANLNNSYTGSATTGQTRGISTALGSNIITGNTVRNLTAASQLAGTTTDAAVLGIVQSSSTAGQTVSENVVHSLANTSTVATSVIGICFAGPTGGTNIIARNLVHSLGLTSVAASAAVTGMQFGTGTFVARNNMVHVGLGVGGESTAVGGFVRGIHDSGTTAGRAYYHNSVYVGGTQTTGAIASYALQSTGTSNTRTFQNNIFFNARVNGGTATSKHYAISHGGTAVNPTGLVSGGNLLFASGAGGILGFYNSADRTTLDAWRLATGQDATSGAADPLFISVSGGAAMVNLHLQPANPASNSALPLIDLVADDFDGQPRGTQALEDIGADAGEFTLSGDYLPPRMICPQLSSGSVTNRTVTGWAVIEDNAGVSGGANAPRLYFKKSIDADTFGGNTSGDNGWKYVSASNATSPYTFTINYALINGGGVNAGDTIQYFVAAQDAAGNLASIPAVASASASPPVQNISAKPVGTITSYTIASVLSGTKTVGSGGDYASLSGAGGLFAALNGAVVGGDLVINITGDLAETGATTLNALSMDDPSSAFTLTLRPGSASMKTISGSGGSGLIRLNGADRVTLDGRFGGTGRFLTFRNTNTASTAGTVQFVNDASNNTVRNCVIEGASSSVVNFGHGVATGNDNNLVTGSQVRNLSTGGTMPSALIYTFGTSATVANSNNAITDNELFNFSSIGVNVNSSGNESWTLTGNNVYNTAAGSSTMYGIVVFCSGTNVVSGNYVHDLTTTSSDCNGIRVNGAANVTVSRNRIVISGINAATTNVRGLSLDADPGSVVNVMNNQIAIVPGGAADTTVVGLENNTGSGVVCNILHNTVLVDGVASGTRNSWAVRRLSGTSDSVHSVYGNIFFNNRTGGTGGHFAAGCQTAEGTYATNHNVYAASGSAGAPAGFMDYGGGANPEPVTFAAWQAATGGDASSSGGNPGGHFTTAMFVSPQTGNLNLGLPANPLVSNRGIPLAGVTTDYEGEPRGAVAPDIGADELISNDAALGAMALSAGSLAPVFDPLTTAYGADVPSTIASLSVLATRSDPNAVITINGQGPALPVSLMAGTNVINVLVTAHNGSTTQTYVVTVTRASASAFEQWAQANNVSNDPQALGPNGLPNLLNFAFNISPASSGALRYVGPLAGGGTISATGQPVVRMGEGGGGPVALFVRRKNHAEAGLAYLPQFSSTLGAWADAEAAPVILADDGTNQVLGVPFPALVGGQKGLFFRVRVSQ